MAPSPSNTPAIERRGPRRGPRFLDGTWRNTSWVLIPVVLALLLIVVARQDYFQRTDLLLQSFLYRSGQPHAVPPVTIVAIDDPSLIALGQYPWKREVYARLLSALDDARPAVVAMDIGFFDRTEEDTAPFVAALRDAAFPVILATKAVSLSEVDSASGFVRASGLQLPLAELHAPDTVTLGFANVLVDRDRTVRRIPAATAGDGLVVPSFAVATIRALYGIDDARDPMRREGDTLVLNTGTYRLLQSSDATIAVLHPTEVPLDATGNFLVNYIGGHDSFPVVPFIDVVNGTADPALLAGRIVLIGATTLDLHDIVNRPGLGAGQIPGVEAHAHAVMTLLARDVLRPVRYPQTVFFTLLYAILAALAARFLHTGRGFVAALVLLASVPVIAAIAFSASALGERAGQLLSLVYPIFALLGSYVGVLLFRIATEEREKKQLRRAFTQYVSPEVVNEILADPSKLKLGGARRELTVLFSDIRGFTTLSERMEAEDLVALLNEYFDIQTEIVLMNRGVIDKFIGDAMMTFWGAPIEEPRQAELACATALAMAATMPVFNADLVTRNLPPIAMGVGLNTGPAVVGNMGSSKRFDYTAMGDTVNLASRLEGLTKAYGVTILVSEHTRRAAELSFVFRTVDKVKVKGKNLAVTVSEIVAAREEGIPEPAFVRVFEEALGSVWMQHWDIAEAKFREVLTLKPDDGPSGVFLERIAEWRVNPPPEDWDGSWAFDHK